MNFTPSDILTALRNHPAAKAAAEEGDDGTAAQLLAASLPPDIVTRRVHEPDIMTAFPTPTAGDAFLTKLEAIAAGQSPFASLTARALRWLRASEGLDIGHAWTRAYLDQLATAAQITTTEAATVKALAEQPPTITTADIATALDPYRPDGRPAPIPAA